MKSLLLPVVEEQSRRHDRKPLRAVYVLITQISEGWVRGHGCGRRKEVLPSAFAFHHFTFHVCQIDVY
jgi:hypothetical protein